MLMARNLSPIDLVPARSGVCIGPPWGSGASRLVIMGASPEMTIVLFALAVYRRMDLGAC